MFSTATIFYYIGGYVSEVVSHLTREKMQTVRRLGKGAYGSVFLVNNGHALKIMDKDEGDRPSAGPLREIIALQSIPRHPNLVELIDSWANSYVYVMMKMYAGDALHISREIPLSFEDLLFVFSSAFNGVSHMHENGWLHRDVKPENIFLWTEGAVIGDFSLARFGYDERAVSQRKSGAMDASTGGAPKDNVSAHICTLWTRPPELVAAELDGRQFVQGYGTEIDIYSLGVSMLALLHGDYVMGRISDYKCTDAEQMAYYLADVFKVLGTDADIFACYKHASSTEFYDEGASLLPFAKKYADEAGLKSFCGLLKKMMHPLPEKRARSEEIAAWIQFNVTTKKFSDPVLLHLHAHLIDTTHGSKVASIDTRRHILTKPSMASCSKLWAAASSAQLPFALAIEALRIQRLVIRAESAIQIESLFYGLELVHRYSYRGRPSTFPLFWTIAPFIQVNYKLYKFAEKLQSQPFLACCLAAEIAVGEWENVEEVMQLIEDQKPTTLSKISSLPFFAGYSNLWTSQKGMRESWKRLEE